MRYIKGCPNANLPDCKGGSFYQCNIDNNFFEKVLVGKGFAGIRTAFVICTGDLYPGSILILAEGAYFSILNSNNAHLIAYYGTVSCPHGPYP